MPVFYSHLQGVPKKVGFRISNSPVVWDDQRLTKLTDTTQQLPPPPATKNLEFPKRNRTSNFGFWPAPKILYAVRMSLRRYPKFYIFTFWHFWPFLGKTKLVIQNRHNHHRPNIQHNRALENLNIQHNRAHLIKMTVRGSNCRSGVG